MPEPEGDFGPRFIALARSVYKTNDERADLKTANQRLARLGDCRSEIVPGATDDGRDWHVGADSIKMPLDNLNRRQAMNRGATWVVLVRTALIAGCNKSDPAVGRGGNPG